MTAPGNALAIAPVTPSQAAAILAAMAQVATLGGSVALSPLAETSLAGAARHVLGAPWPTPPGAAVPDLAGALPQPDQRRMAVEMATIMALLDGRIDPARLDRVVALARDLEVTDDFVQDLALAAQGQIHQVTVDMSRQNVDSIPGLAWQDDVLAIFLPYRDGHADPALAARFQALGSLPYAAFGRAFFDHYQLNHYPFPGEPKGLAEAFAVPHDSAHLLSGYSTSSQGELLVSTFTAAMHRKEGMGGHILPVIFSWHLGIELNAFAGATTGALDPEKFWNAWERGSRCTMDTFSPGFDFWSLVDVPLETLRARFGIPPLAPDEAAVGLPAPVR